MLTVIGKIDEVGEFKTAKHYEERTHREKNGEKVIEAIFEVKKFDRPQLHIILSDATVLVVDKVKQTIITILNARPSQIKRYYNPLGLNVPVYLLAEATSNTMNNLNK
ncbi:MAG: hypothetical protein ACRCTC_06665 [Cetobacterium sp.]